MGWPLKAPQGTFREPTNRCAGLGREHRLVFVNVWRLSMRISFSFGADPRGAQGKGASRRLRRAGKVPAILYGGHKEAQPLVLDQQNLLTMIGDERFYSSIVQLKMGGIVSHMRTEVEVSCLPKDLPEFLELDLSEMSLNDTKFLADIPLPPGVTIPELAHRNTAVVSIHAPRAAEPEPTAAEAAAAAAPAEGAAAAPGAAAAAAAATPAGAEAKKG